MNKNDQIDIILPVLPLRDIVVFPGMIVPLFVGREKSIAATEAAVRVDQKIFLVTQKNIHEDDPQKDDLYSTGVVANVLQVLRLPEGRLKILVEVLQRAKIKELKSSEDMLRCVVNIPVQTCALPLAQEALILSDLLHHFELYLRDKHIVSSEIISSLADAAGLDALINAIAAQLDLPLEKSQEILGEFDLEKQANLLLNQVKMAGSREKVQQEVQSRVKEQINKNHHEYLLNEYLKAINKELHTVSGEENELDKLEKEIAASEMPPEALEKSKAELKKLRGMSTMSPEFTVSRNYLDWMIKLPWTGSSELKHDLEGAQKLLDNHHYGLEKVKERILEHLAVIKRVNKLKGPILCLVGPPGVGKTSLAKSIAEASGREYTRFALGGVRDEAEIRGHRRTYIGAMPGKILQNLAKVKTNNPLFLLDEIDKMSSDSRGDPASALLEVLDPEQNKNFNDHYIDIDFDLSNVLFIATANTLNIPAPLRDRMEIIRLAGYTEDEKMHIAENYLIPKQMSEHGLKSTELKFSAETLKAIVRYYTREAGVRELERSIAKICRKVVKQTVSNQKTKKFTITEKNLVDYLGVYKFNFGIAESENRVGQVNGLAWTEMGGDLLAIEVAVVPGTGVVSTTGSLGDVMQESIKAAMTVVRDRARYFTMPKDFYKKLDTHVHLPEGATPKDGPSAGIAICVALLSELTDIPVRSDVAMTGEITLRGEVLPIGGLKEKLLAAHRGGVKTVIIPEQNRKDLSEIPEKIRKGLDIKCVRWIDEVIMLALERAPALIANKNSIHPTNVVTEIDGDSTCHLIH